MMKAAMTCALLFAAGAAAQNAPTSGSSNCTRESIVAAIAAVPTLSIVSQALVGLNLTTVLPNQEGPGTVFLPTNDAFAALGIPATELAARADQLTAIVAYHSLLAQGEVYNRKALVANSPITTDLGVVSQAVGGEDYTVTIAASAGSEDGLEQISGVPANNTGTIRGVIKVCGLYVYPITVVLLPAATLDEIPAELGAAIRMAATDPAAAAAAGGLGAAVASGAFSLAGAAGPASGPSGMMAPASAPGAAAGVEGQALALNGTDGTLTSTSPVLLTGTVTSSDGAASLGPGLLYLDGPVTDGVGVSGTATEVANLTASGAELGSRSLPLGGATVNGTAFSADGIETSAAGPAAGPSPAVSPAEADNGFGKAIVENADGTFSVTPADGPILFDGNVTGGTAAGDAATGTAAEGSLGPGAIFVNGTVTDSMGESGMAYPVVSLTGDTITLNQDNGIDISGATFSGTAYNASGIMTTLQAADGPGGAGAASSGSPGVVGGTAGASGPTGAAGPEGASAPGPAGAGTPTAAPTSAAPATAAASLAAIAVVAAAAILA